MLEADILLHLIDMSHPKAQEQAQDVYRTLESIGVEGKEIIPVLNKIDLVENKAAIERAMDGFSSQLAISAAKGYGLDELTRNIESRVERFLVDVSLVIPMADIKVLNMIYENGVVTRKEFKADKVYVEARVSQKALDKLRPYGKM